MLGGSCIAYSVYLFMLGVGVDLHLCHLSLLRCLLCLLHLVFLFKSLSLEVIIEFAVL